MKSALQVFGLILWAVLAARSNQAQNVENVLSTGLFEPYAIAVGPGNLYYITDSANNRIVVFNPNSGAVTNLAGQAGANGKGAIDSTNGLAARFYSPQGIVLSSVGLVVADSGNNLIRLVDFNGKVTTILGDIRQPRTSHDNNLPIENAGTNDGPGFNAQVNAPAGLAVESDDTVLIADLLNGTIRRLHLTGSNIVTTLMVRDGGTTNLIPAHFNRPTAIAISTNGVFIADSGRHSIYKLKENDSIELIAGAGNSFVSGYKDDIVPTQALFKGPRGLWVDDTRAELLISDSGNGLIRRLTGIGTGSGRVETLSTDTPSGILNPVGIVRDRESLIVFADLDANAIKGLRQTASQPPVTAPQIGIVVFDGVSQCFKLSAVTNATFYNEQVLAITSEPNTVTSFVSGPSASTLADPSSENGSAPPTFSDCAATAPENLLNRIQSRSPVMTIKAISSAANRKSSPVTTANFVFQSATPSIVAADATSISFNTVTEGAVILYTYGTNPPPPTIGGPSTFQYNGNSINLFDETHDVVVKVAAFKDNYLDSPVNTRIFQKADARRSVVGVPRDFTASVGSTVIVPMTLDVAPSNVVRTLQYRIEIAPKGAAKTNATPQPFLLNTSSNDMININFAGAKLASSAAYSLSLGKIQGLVVTFLQTNINFVVTNLVTLGVLGIDVPPNAREGDQYSITVVKPTGTSDGVDTPVSLVPGAVRTLMITNRVYAVGDVAPATWYNIGDFGGSTPTDPSLENNDVLLAFRAALGISVPYRFSDVFDAMDVFPIDSLDAVGGDGVIRYLDYQTILRRSLGLDPDVWLRKWTADGVRVSVSPDGTVGHLDSGETIHGNTPKTGTTPTIVWTKDALISGESSHATQGGLARVPVYLNVRSGRRVAGMQFSASVTAQGANPAISSVNFVPAAGIPGSSLSAAGPGSISCAWNLGAFNPALTGNTLIGYIQFTVPTLAFTGQNYLIQFSGADGSPDLNTQYNFETSRTFLNVSLESNVADDAISDEWKIAFFGSVDEPMAAANLDPDGDGATNLAEFRDGTNPLVNNFRMQVTQGAGPGGNLTLQWFGASGLNYSVEGSTGIKDWTPVAPSSIPGQGGTLQFITQNSGAFRFYRVRIVP